jgi:TIR domain
MSDPTPMNDYLYDIFISYRRWDEEWVRWTERNFVRPLRSLLRPALGDVKIFIDNQIESGASWPLRLAKALAYSKVFIPVLSRDYFRSDWCRLELALMLHREKQTGFCCQANPSGLILPIVIDDGDCFPSEIQAIQSKQTFHEFANPCMCLDSPKQENFAGAIKVWIPEIELALRQAPPLDPNWENVAHEEFLHLFEIKTQRQTAVPGLSLAPVNPPNHQP